MINLHHLTHYAVLYPQNGDCIVTIDSVTSHHLMYTSILLISQWRNLSFGNAVAVGDAARLDACVYIVENREVGAYW